MILTDAICWAAKSTTFSWDRGTPTDRYSGMVQDLIKPLAELGAIKIIALVLEEGPPISEGRAVVSIGFSERPLLNLFKGALLIKGAASSCVIATPSIKGAASFGIAGGFPADLLDRRNCSFGWSIIHFLRPFNWDIPFSLLCPISARSILDKERRHSPLLHH